MGVRERLPPSPLERAVIEAIADQLPAHAEAIKGQLSNATVKSRTNSGAGFYTVFEVSSGPPIEGLQSPIGDVGAAVEGIPYGMGFLIWLDDGRLNKLEGYAYGDDTLGVDFDNARAISLHDLPTNSPLRRGILPTLKRMLLRGFSFR